MDREKQIEEMAKVIHDLDKNYNNVLPSSLADCVYKHGGTRTNEAVALYNAGYRKQSEGEWVVTDADSGSFGEYAPFIEFKCPSCESGYGIESGQYGWEYGDPIPWVSCPLCGAKMKGGEG